jgi:phosphatidylglycerol:prolipoprotein diacylglycerol transferase
MAPDLLRGWGVDPAQPWVATALLGGLLALALVLLLPGCLHREEGRLRLQLPPVGSVVAALVVAGTGVVLWRRLAQAGTSGSVILLPTYGVIFAGAAALAIAWLAWDVHRRPDPAGLSRADVLDSAFWVVVGGMLGARALALVTSLRQALLGCLEAPSLRNGFCLEVLQPWDGGLVFLGGVLGGALVLGLWARARGLGGLRVLDTWAPTVALGHALGRWACVAGGCCFGAPCDNPLGLRYPTGSPAWAEQLVLADTARIEALADLDSSLPTWPVPIFESVGQLVLFGLLLTLRARGGRPGSLTAAWLLGYGVLRFGLEFLRGDTVRGAWWAFTPSQWMALAMVACALALALRPPRPPA